MIEVRKATKLKKKANILIYGPTGSGKSLSSIAIMAGLTNKGKFAVIDAEYERSDFYGKFFDFDIMPIKENFHPNKYIERIDYAAKNNYQGIIIDTLSQVYTGKGGIIEIADSAKALYNDNSFLAWKDATHFQEKLINKINSTSTLHRIVLLRSELRYRYDKESKKVVMIGLKPIFREKREINYEFDLVCRMTRDHELVIETTRCDILADKVFKFRLGNEGIEEAYNLGTLYNKWLEDSIEPITVTDEEEILVSQKLWDYLREKQLSKKSVHNLLSFLGLMDEKGKFKANLFTNKVFNSIKEKLDSFDPKEDLNLFLESDLELYQKQDMYDNLNLLNPTLKKSFLKSVMDEYKVDSIWNLDKDSFCTVMSTLKQTIYNKNENE